MMYICYYTLFWGSVYLLLHTFEKRETDECAITDIHKKAEVCNNRYTECAITNNE